MSGILVGGLAHSIMDTDVMLAGASGGCYSLIGAHFAIVVMVSDTAIWMTMGKPHQCFTCTILRRNCQSKIKLTI